LGSFILLAGNAGAVDGRVSSACAGDYLAYCSQHDPDGPRTRRCMRANGLKLSQACVNALVAAEKYQSGKWHDERPRSTLDMPNLAMDPFLQHHVVGRLVLA
jgi:hypothetical protein